MMNFSEKLQFVECLSCNTCKWRHWDRSHQLHLEVGTQGFANGLGLCMVDTHNHQAINSLAAFPHQMVNRNRANGPRVISMTVCHIFWCSLQLSTSFMTKIPRRNHSELSWHQSNGDDRHNELRVQSASHNLRSHWLIILNTDVRSTSIMMCDAWVMVRRNILTLKTMTFKTLNEPISFVRDVCLCRLISMSPTRIVLVGSRMRLRLRVLTLRLWLRFH